MADVFLILGPTASGKSSLAMALAQALQPQHRIELINIDSALVYRGMDIGTAKPSAQERARVPHHLIDIIDPLESYSAARFVSDAQALIRQIRARGAVPLLVGGTMLYVKALLEGLHELPATRPDVRLTVLQEASTHGWPAMHAQLARIDPDTAQRLAPNDAQRIGRALELFLQTGRPMSQWLAQPRAGQAATPGGGRYRLISLEPSDRARLHARIAQRFDAMLAQGFLDEVRRLRARGDLDPTLSSMRCVGYRQAWDWLDASETAAREGRAGPPLSQLREQGIAATRQLAKRQLTWLRGMAQREVFDCLAADLPDQVLPLVKAGLQP